MKKFIAKANPKNALNEIVQKDGKRFYNKVDPSFVADKLFWKTVKPFLSNKGN